MNRIYTLLLMSFIPFVSVAQQMPYAQPHYSLSAAMEIMRSTHGNAFYGPSIRGNYLFANGWEPGIGVEYAASREHHDNGFVLSRLKFIPVYGNLKYNFATSTRVAAFAETSLGVSTNTYDIADERTPTIKRLKRERGFYTYVGGGIKYHPTKSLDFFSGIGLKAYKISRNALDINPHGLSFMLGVSIH